MSIYKLEFGEKYGEREYQEMVLDAQLVNDVFNVVIGCLKELIESKRPDEFSGKRAVLINAIYIKCDENKRIGADLYAFLLRFCIVSYLNFSECQEFKNCAISSCNLLLARKSSFDYKIAHQNVDGLNKEIMMLLEGVLSAISRWK